MAQPESSREGCKDTHIISHFCFYVMDHLDPFIIIISCWWRRRFSGLEVTGALIRMYGCLVCSFGLLVCLCFICYQSGVRGDNCD